MGTNVNSAEFTAVEMTENLITESLNVEEANAAATENENTAEAAPMPAFPSEEEQLRKLGEMQPTIVRVCRSAVKRRPLYAGAKRVFDIVASLLGLIVLSPFFIIISRKIRKESPGSAIFKQYRVGKHGKPFMMYKFRSMYADAEERLEEVLAKNKGENSLLFKADDDDRITPFGRKIRDNSVDELPQLINILKGEMSFVGPRPPLVREVIQYEDEQTIRLAVKGGLTCFWQLTGRNDADFDFCLEQDKKYLEKRGFWLDLWLVIRTVTGIVGGRLSGE